MPESSVVWSQTKGNCHVLRVAEEARTKGKPTAVGMIYDELVRKNCADKAHSGLAGYNQNKTLQTYSREFVEQAAGKLDAQKMLTGYSNYGKDKAKGHGKKGDGKGGKTGNYNQWDNKRKFPWDKGYWAEKGAKYTKH